MSEEDQLDSSQPPLSSLPRLDSPFDPDSNNSNSVRATVIDNNLSGAFSIDTNSLQPVDSSQDNTNAPSILSTEDVTTLITTIHKAADDAWLINVDPQEVIDFQSTSNTYRPSADYTLPSSEELAQALIQLQDSTFLLSATIEERLAYVIALAIQNMPVTFSALVFLILECPRVIVGQTETLFRLINDNRFTMDLSFAQLFDSLWDCSTTSEGAFELRSGGTPSDILKVQRINCLRGVRNYFFLRALLPSNDPNYTSRYALADQNLEQYKADAFSLINNLFTRDKETNLGSVQLLNLCLLGTSHSRKAQTLPWAMLVNRLRPNDSLTHVKSDQEMVRERENLSRRLEEPVAGLLLALYLLVTRVQFSAISPAPPMHTFVQGFVSELLQRLVVAIGPIDPTMKFYVKFYQHVNGQPGLASAYSTMIGSLKQKTTLVKWTADLEARITATVRLGIFAWFTYQVLQVHYSQQPVRENLTQRLINEFSLEGNDRVLLASFISSHLDLLNFAAISKFTIDFIAASVTKIFNAHCTQYIGNAMRHAK